MKKSKSSSKRSLTLNKQTLAILSRGPTPLGAQQLVRAAGGKDDTVRVSDSCPRSDGCGGGPGGN